MAILLPADRDRYFPAIDLSGAALLGAIDRAQMTAETACNRLMDSTRYEETVRVPPSGLIPLAYWPLTKGKPIELFRVNSLGLLDCIDSSAYELTSEGFIQLRGFERREDVINSGRAFGHSYGIDRLNNPYTRTQQNMALRLVYWSGLEDSIPAKSAVAAILNYQVLS